MAAVTTSAGSLRRTHNSIKCRSNMTVRPFKTRSRRTARSNGLDTGLVRRCFGGQACLTRWYRLDEKGTNGRAAGRVRNNGRGREMLNERAWNIRRRREDVDEVAGRWQSAGRRERDISAGRAGAARRTHREIAAEGILERGQLTRRGTRMRVRVHAAR